MKSLHTIQARILEQLNDLYEALYLAQEKIEESGFLDLALNKPARGRSDVLPERELLFP